MTRHEQYDPGYGRDRQGREGQRGWGQEQYYPGIERQDYRGQYEQSYRSHHEQPGYGSLRSGQSSPYSSQRQQFGQGFGEYGGEEQYGRDASWRQHYGQGQFGYGPNDDSSHGIGQAAQYGYGQGSQYRAPHGAYRSGDYEYDQQTPYSNQTPYRGQAYGGQYGGRTFSSEHYRPGYETGRRSGSQQGAWGEGEWGWSDDVRLPGRTSGNYEMKRGRAPKNYKRSDDRIKEEINDRLMMSNDIDPSDVEVQVEGGEVTLTGTVSERHDKQAVERIAESILGVDEVMNQIRVKRESGKSANQAKGYSQGSAQSGNQNRMGAGMGEEGDYGNSGSSASSRKTSPATTSR